MPVEIVNGVPFPIAKKPTGCTCEFPVVMFQNACGHHPDCPSYHAWREAKKAVKVNKDPEADTVVLAQGALIPPQGGSGTAQPKASPVALFGSRMVLSELELSAAVQYYLENVVFRAGCAPRVQSVRQHEQEFEVRFGSRDGTTNGGDAESHQAV